MNIQDHKRLQLERQKNELEAKTLRNKIATKKAQMKALQNEINSLENQLLKYPATSNEMSLRESLEAVRNRYRA